MAVLNQAMGGDRLDALSDWPSGGWPVMLVNDAVAGERTRFTAAHELGHAVMHAADTGPVPEAHGDVLPGREPDREREADRFAAELLMPAAHAASELAGVTLDRLGPLKKRWGVSRAMLAMRARDLGALTDTQYRRMVTEMSAAGWRTREPDPLATETPALLREALDQARRRFGDQHVSDHILAHPHQLNSLF
jgi:Zn-dependent peptidase ImmA (M78 family)